MESPCLRLRSPSLWCLVAPTLCAREFGRKVQNKRLPQWALLCCGRPAAQGRAACVSECDFCVRANCDFSSVRRWAARHQSQSAADCLRLCPLEAASSHLASRRALATRQAPYAALLIPCSSCSPSYAACSRVSLSAIWPGGSGAPSPGDSRLFDSGRLARCGLAAPRDWLACLAGRPPL